MNSSSKWALVQLVFCSWVIAESVSRFLGWPALVLAVVGSGAFAATLYLARFEPALAARWSASKWGEVWLDWVCKTAQVQRPTDVRHAAGERHLRVQTRDDFARLIQDTNQDVYGHEPSVRHLGAALERLLELRWHREDRDGLPPLAAFLLAGPRGIGKRHLAARLGGGLFRDAWISTWDLARYADVAALLGSDGQEGELLVRVRNQPRHVLILEGGEAAASSVLEAVTDLLRHGSWGSGRQGVVRFQDCVFFLLAHTPASSTTVLSREALLDQLSFPPVLAHRLDESVQLLPLTDEDRARVVIRLVYDACRRYGLELAYLDPVLIVRELEAMRGDHEFAATVSSIERWLQPPIHAAARSGMQTLVLTSDWVDSLASAAALAPARPSAAGRLALARPA